MKIDSALQGISNQVSLSSADTAESKYARYRQLIIQLLMQHLSAPVNGEVMTMPVLDQERDHYQLLDIGWDEAGKRVFQPIIHIDLLDGKIWIQENAMDVDIAKDLVAEGVEPLDIVLGLHSRSLRKFSEYGIE
jgi:XisI protein